MMLATVPPSIRWPLFVFVLVPVMWNLAAFCRFSSNWVLIVPTQLWKPREEQRENILKVSVISLFVKTYMCIENWFWCDYACDSCRCIYLSVCLGCSVSWTEEGARRKCRKSYLWEFIRELCVKSVAPESLRELAEAVTVNNNSCEWSGYVGGAAAAAACLWKTSNTEEDGYEQKSHMKTNITSQE